MTGHAHHADAAFLGTPVILPVAARSPDALIAFGGAGTRTLEDLARDVRLTSAAMPQARAGSHVVLLCDDRYRFLVTLLAAWASGHAVALPPNSRTGSVGTLANLSEVLATFHDSDDVDGVDVRGVLESQANVLPEPDDVWPVRVKPDKVVATFFTSGTTRNARGVQKTARQLFNEVNVLQSTFGLGFESAVFATVPPQHLYGLLFTVLWPLAVGAAISRDVPFHVEAIVEVIKNGGRTGVTQHRKSVLVTVPAHLAGFPRIAPQELRGTRIFTSTAPMDASVARSVVEAQSVDIIGVFGSTETGGIAWRYCDRDGGWRPFQGVDVMVDNDGHVAIRSSFLPDDQPFRTEDRAVVAEDGTFTHVGRADDVVKIGGRRVSLADLEAGCLKVAGVTDACVIAVPDDGPRNSRIVALVAPSTVDIANIKATLSQWFDAVVVPKRIVPVDSLPREANGKIPKERVLAMIVEPTGGAYFHAPTGPTKANVQSPSESTGPREIVVTRLAASPCGAESEASNTTWFDVTVPTDAWQFDGHFPGYAILPGVAMLHSVVMRAVAALDGAPEAGLREVSRLKFRRPVRPGDQLVLKLTRSDTDSSDFSINFNMNRGSELVASGRLRFGEP